MYMSRCCFFLNICNEWIVNWDKKNYGGLKGGGYVDVGFMGILGFQGHALW